MSTPVERLLYQHEYEAALGRLLVRFNDLEISVGEILEQSLDRLKVPHLYRAEDYYIHKVDRLELTLKAMPKWPVPDFIRLRRINGWRNDLAHGHFHQDPNTGEYLTRPVHKAARKAKAGVITPEDIDKFTDELRDAQTDVGRLLPHVWFDEIEEDHVGA